MCNLQLLCSGILLKYSDIHFSIQPYGAQNSSKQYTDLTANNVISEYKAQQINSV